MASPSIKTKKTDVFTCCKCGTEYKSLEKNFRASKSELYKARNNRLPICNKCLDAYYDHYVEKYDGDEYKAFRRICMLFDIYYNKEIAGLSKNGNRGSSRIGNYISRANLQQYKDKTYDTTIEEEDKKLNIAAYHNTEDNEDISDDLFNEAIRIFGVVNSRKDAKVLKFLYDDWMVKTGANSKVQEEIIKNICWDLLNIMRARESGESTKDFEKSFLDNVKFGGWQPNTKDENLSTMTLGTWIKKVEMNKSIEDSKEKSYFKELISVYYLGQLSKSVGIKNIYVKEYDEHMKKYTIERSLEDNKQRDEVVDKVFG